MRSMSEVFAKHRKQGVDFPMPSLHGNQYLYEIGIACTARSSQSKQFVACGRLLETVNKACRVYFNVGCIGRPCRYFNVLRVSTFGRGEMKPM